MAPRLGVVAFVAVAVLGQSLTAQGEADATRRSRINVYPFAFYTPETGLALGGGGVLTYYAGEEASLRPSNVTVAAYYSTINQYSVAVMPRTYFGDNRWLASAELSASRIVDKYWGIGNETPELDSASYVANRGRALLELQMPLPLSRVHRWGLLYDIEGTGIADRRSNPLLEDTTLVGYDGGLLSGIGAIMAWDSRDHVFFPTRGMFHQVRSTFFPPFLGSAYGFTSHEVDLRWYFPLRSDMVIALQTFGEFTTGDVPFYRLAALGGEDRMRGYYEGRYRDKDFVSVQVEYRTHVWWRFGAVAFVGTGEVMPRLADFRFGELHISGGGGVRFTFNEAERVNLRVDMGFGQGTSGLYFGIEEAF
jgi:outer membrane protein assembly factor BamA